MARDNFSEKNKKIIAERAGYLCSRPGCRILTSGPHSDDEKSLTSGVAAHIYAASPRGPRYNPSQPKKKRTSVSNGIWICHTCSDLVDKDKEKYTGEVLVDWKREHALYLESLIQSRNQIGRGGNGGHIFITAPHLSGNGKFTVDGGDGLIGGNAGTINIDAKVNNFAGELSAKGGNSTSKSDKSQRIGILNKGKGNKFTNNTFTGLDIGIKDLGEDTTADGNEFN